MNQSVQNAVSAAIRPMNGHDRFGVQCNRADCACTADWRVGARVWPRGMAPQKRTHRNCAILNFPLVVCDEHRASAVLEDIVGDSNWQHICKALRQKGKTRPDRRSIELVFTSLGRKR